MAFWDFKRQQAPVFDVIFCLNIRSPGSFVLILNKLPAEDDPEFLMGVFRKELPEDLVQKGLFMVVMIGVLAVIDDSIAVRSDRFTEPDIFVGLWAN